MPDPTPEEFAAFADNYVSDLLRGASNPGALAKFDPLANLPKVKERLLLDPAEDKAREVLEQLIPDERMTIRRAIYFGPLQPDNPRDKLILDRIRETFDPNDPQTQQLVQFTYQGYTIKGAQLDSGESRLVTYYYT